MGVALVFKKRIDCTELCLKNIEEQVKTKF